MEAGTQWGTAQGLWVAWVLGGDLATEKHICVSALAGRTVALSFR